MADSKFRNKQWFKALTDKEKKALCKKYGCSEAGLKKAGYVEDDGKLKIDILRLDYVEIPDEWNHEHEVVTSSRFVSLLEDLAKSDSVENDVEIFETMYLEFHPGTKFKKADVKKGKIWIGQTKLSLSNIIKDMKSEPEDIEIGVLMCYSHKIYTHLKVLFNSDLNNIKV